MQVLKNYWLSVSRTASSCFFSIAAVELIGLLGLAMPVAEVMMAHGSNPWVAVLTLIGITALAILPDRPGWKPLLRYVSWLEPELRRRERLTCKACTSARSTRAA